MSLRSRVRSLIDCRRGSAAVEAAFVLPLFLMALLGTFEMGRLAWAQSALDFAVEETARCASVRPDLCGTSAQAADFAARKIAALGIGSAAFTSSVETCGTRIRAAVEHKFIMYPIFPAGPTLRAEFCRR